MNSVIEKEKKLNLALAKLKNLNLKNPDVKKNIENLSRQKNQLEIEKQELEEKYKSLLDEYNSLSHKLDELSNLEKIEQKKQLEFSVDLKLISFLKETFANAKIKILLNKETKNIDLLCISGGNDILKFSKTKKNILRHKLDKHFYNICKKRKGLIILLYLPAM